MLAQSQFSEGQFRPGFDLVLGPALDGGEKGPSLVPLARHHLLSFSGEHRLSQQTRSRLEKAGSAGGEADDEVIKILRIVEIV